MSEMLQNDVVLLFNLSHDVMVKFRADGSCTLEAFDQDAPPIRLERTHQLLLLDALCNFYSFPSPVAEVVTHREMPPQVAPEDNPEAYTMSELPPLPPLEGIE